MELEDKVDISLSVADVKLIVSDFLEKKHGVQVKELHFNVKAIPDDDSIYSSYKLKDITGIGVRIKS